MSNADSDRKARIAELVEEFLNAERDGQPLDRAAWLSANSEYRPELAEFLSSHKPQEQKVAADQDGNPTYVIPGERDEGTAEQFTETIDTSNESPPAAMDGTIVESVSPPSQGTIVDSQGPSSVVPTSFDQTMPGEELTASKAQTMADEVHGQTQVPEDSDATMVEAPSSGTIVEGQSQVDGSRLKSTQFRQRLSSKAAERGEQPYNPPALDGDRYELTDFVARGGIGEVWQADDMRLGRGVALKSLRRGRETMRARFILEAELTGRLEHPGVVPIHDLALDRNDEPYYVMKFVRGRSMKDMIKDYFGKSKKKKKKEAQIDDAPATVESRQLMFQRLLDSFVSLCETIGYAHQHGIIHRDIKPENVMVGEFGETLVLDWGLAKDKSAPEEKVSSLSDIHLSSTGTETQAGSVMGSPGYMAPELVEGEAHIADERTDIYLLGASLYEILTSKAPHHSGSLTGMLDRARQGVPDPPKDHNPNAPKVLVAICLKAMQKAREDRYVSAMDVAQDVRRYLAGEPVSAYQENLFEQSIRWAKKHRVMLSRTAAGLVLASVLWFAWSLRSENQQLAAIEQARTDVAQFEKLADEAQYFAATSDRLDDSTPYYDPAVAQQAADEALKISATWGSQLDGLPLNEMRESVGETLHGLLLITVQSRLSDVGDVDDRAAAATEELRGLLRQAVALKGESTASNRLSAALDQSITSGPAGKDDSKSGTSPALSDETSNRNQTALDHFLNAEELRRRASRSGSTDGDEWNAHEELLEQAIAGYREAIRLRTSDFWSHFQMGRCYLSLGRYSESVETLGACVALRPDSPWSYSARGLALAMLNRFDEAIADLDRAIELDNEFLPAKLNRGVTYWLAGQRDTAETEFTALLDTADDSQVAEAAYYRAALRWDAGDAAAALADLNTVLAARPKFPAALLLLCRISYLTGEVDQAKQHLNAWLEVNSADSNTTSNDSSFDADGWKACYERARFLRRLTSSSIPAGIELDRKKLLTLALAELQEAIKQGGDSAELYSETGSVLELFGAAEDAYAAYSKSLAIKPDDDALLVKRGWLQALRLGNGDGAIADFEAALKANPENAEAHSAHGFLLALRNPSADAEQAALRAILHGAGDYLILHNVACIYAELAVALPDESAAYEQSALDILERGLQLWKKGNRSGPNAIQLASQESSFRNLSKRPSFKTLLESAASN